eukprot:7068742-Pyramimonas_sp.AAC.1
MQSNGIIPICYLYQVADLKNLRICINPQCDSPRTSTRPLLRRAIETTWRKQRAPYRTPYRPTSR